MKYFYFLLSIVSLLCFLLLLNVLPLYFDKALLREYANINELQISLKIQKLPIPTYLTENIKWPPSKILGQSTPYLAIILGFASAIDNETILYFSMSENKNFKYPNNIILQNNSKTFSININNRPALIKAGLCEDNINCSEIIINDVKYQIVLKGKMQLPTLLRIAQSINFED
jgi:hypothetical protein